jgi:hypothetical protein
MIPSLDDDAGRERPRMHLQNAFKIAPVSRKPSTELRQRLQVQKCARRDRLPARMPIQANLRWKFEKGNSVRWDVNPLRSREKPEVHQRANSDSQNDQDQSCKDSIGETWKSKRRGAYSVGRADQSRLYRRIFWEVRQPGSIQPALRALRPTLGIRTACCSTPVWPKKRMRGASTTGT